MKKTTNQKVYEIIQEEILRKLDEGVIPWRMTWEGGFPMGTDKNIISKKEYQGFNSIWLHCQGFSSPYWLTFKQAKQLKGNIKKGEKGTIIIFWKFLDITERNEAGELEEKQVPLLRYYRVFNLDQTEGIELKEESKPITKFENNTIENCEKIVFGFTDKPEIVKARNPHYKPVTDKVGMPEINLFESSEEYYAALFHELAHSTAHKDRLNRISKKYSYGKEELVAEMTASFLCAIAGINDKTVDNQAAYIKGWKEKIKADIKLVISASTQAQKASDYILNVKKESQKQVG